MDTGALYRAVALFTHTRGIPFTDENALAPSLSDINVELAYIAGEQRVFLCGRDVSEDIRKPEMSMAASHVSALPSVRAFLLDLQRDMAKRYNVVMDGRDIGTVVLPEADLKIFLTASPEARARRRHNEYLQKGDPPTFEWVLSDIKNRDYNDENRAHAPLCQAEGAVLLDTTELTLEESISLVLKTVREFGIS